MANFNFGGEDPFVPNPEDADKDSIPATEELKRSIYDRVRAIAQTGEYREPFERTAGWHRATTELPGTNDGMTVVSYDAPSRTRGLEGFIAQINYSKTVEGSRIVTAEGLELYRKEITRYKFFEIPDGLHVEREVDQADEPVEYYRKGPISADEIDWNALHDAFRGADEDRAMQRELGLNFFSEADAENVVLLLEQAWPSQG